MSAEGKKKRGIAGASNAKSIPYRYVGGTHDNPVLTDPAARLARTVTARNHRELATYNNGLLGGLLAAALGYEGGFENWREVLGQRQSGQ